MSGAITLLTGTQVPSSDREEKCKLFKGNTGRRHGFVVLQSLEICCNENWVHYTKAFCKLLKMYKDTVNALLLLNQVLLEWNLCP